PLPFECETFGAPEEPVLGVSVGVTPAVVTELLLAMPSAPMRTAQHPEAIQSAALDAPLADATVRLLECLRTDHEAKILGPPIVREIIYRVLCGEPGGALRVLAAPDSAFGQISRVLHRIHADFARAIDVPTL